MVVLPSAYLPSISYFRHLLSEEEVVIDCGEHFVKRSLRNRTSIMTAQGAMRLTVPICNANRPRTRMVDVMIDNSKRWQHQHWIAIVSAYRSSPYFDHYAPYLEPLFMREWGSLVEFNRALLSAIIKLFNMGQRGVLIAEPSYSDSYIEVAEGVIDLRDKGAVEQGFVATPYIQVFSDRVEFIPNLSVLDLLLCEGPSSLSLVAESGRF
ncbi:MAG: WbqC family protein [Rikenellaceae bacterium]